MRAERVSIIVPALNEASGIEAMLRPLQAWRTEGHELILVDGGSTDGTPERASPWCDRVLTSPPGRALQMNAGARIAGGEVLWFLHADTSAPADALSAMLGALDATGRCWGRFDVQLSGDLWPLRLVERLMNLRSCLSGIATGDQGLFVRRAAFESIGGFPSIPLMEDIALSRRLRRLSRPVCLRRRLVTSSRRWETRGVWRTIVLMWRLRLAYALGADPEALARRYR
jgi:rSAM/selenodomain-associated transferase 2